MHPSAAVRMDPIASNIEQGDHPTLLAQGGRNAALLSQQYGDALVEAWVLETSGPAT